MPPTCWTSSTCLARTAFDRTWLAFSRGKRKPSKMKKISSTKAKKTETSEQGDAHFKVALPKPLSRNRHELDGATEPEGRRQGHNPRPDGVGVGALVHEGRGGPMARGTGVRHPTAPTAWRLCTQLRRRRWWRRGGGRGWTRGGSDRGLGRSVQVLGA